MHAEPSTASPVADVPSAPETPRIVLRVHPEMPVLAFPEGIALEVLADPVSIRIPNARRWLGGVVGLRGNLLPILDLAAWAGYRTETGAGRLLAVSAAHTPFALVGSGLPELLTIATDDRQGLDVPAPPSADALAPYLGHAYATRVGVVYEFDMHGWLAEIRRALGGSAPG